MSKLRFLFVDDDAPILVAMERTARRYRSELEAVFACGGGAGLAAFATGQFDAVISDMRMPKTDGAAVVAAAREQQPGALRIVLSGQADRDAVLRSAADAQQYLSKPTGPNAIGDVMTRVQSLHARLRDPGLRELAGSVGQFPLLPQVRGELLGGFAGPDASAREVAGIVACDSGLCAKILQIANAGFLGAGRPCLTIEDAVGAVGVDTVSQLIAVMPSETDPAAEKLQRAALAAAGAAARVFADPVVAAQAYTAALLGNLGRRICGGAFPDATAAAVGAYVLEAWGLPASIVESAALGGAPTGPAGEVGSAAC